MKDEFEMCKTVIQSSQNVQLKYWLFCQKMTVFEAKTVNYVLYLPH